MSDPVDEHLDKAFASLEDFTVRELMATSEALERRRDSLRDFASIFRQVADARGESWGTDLPRFHLGECVSRADDSSPCRLRMRRPRFGAMCAMRWPSGIRNSPPPFRNPPAPPSLRLVRRLTASLPHRLIHGRRVDMPGAGPEVLIRADVSASASKSPTEEDDVPVSESFTKLKSQVEEADESIKAAASQDKAAVEAKADEARKRAATRAADLRARGQEASDEAQANWQRIQDDWNQHTQRMHERIDAKKAEVKADMAESDAEWAEADAAYAIEFAAEAVDEALYAVLASVRARKDAEIAASS